MRNPCEVSGPLKALTSYSFSGKNKINKRTKSETKRRYLPGCSMEKQKNTFLYNPFAFIPSLDTMHTMNP